MTAQGPSAAPLLAALQPLVSRVRTDVSAIKLPGAGSRWTDEALTQARLAKHLNGGPARGVCPIKAGGSTTQVAVLDLDAHDGASSWPEMQQAAAGIVEALEASGLRAVPFRSSGGRGIHLYLLWASPQDAYSVRTYLAEVLAGIGYRSGTKGVAAREIEVFPKQDAVPADGYGNQFILPYAGASVPLEPLLDMEAMPRDYAVAWPDSAPVPVRVKPERPVLAPVSADLAELRSALAAIPNAGEDELGYDNWRNIIFGIHSATGGSDEGLALAHEFSAKSAKYLPEFLDQRVWPYVADRDDGITAATVFAQARSYGWGAASLDDFDDVTAQAGAGETIKPEGEGSPPQRYEVVPAAEFAAGRVPSWWVKNLLPQADLVVLFGESGAGKSFVALDIAAAIARGVSWRGLRVKQGRVVYIAAEGGGGFRARLRAYAQQQGIDLGDVPLDVIHAVPNFLQKADALDVAKAIKAARGADIIIIDTFAQVTAGANENAAEDMGKALAHCRGIRRATGATIILVHHAGKDLSKGSRGWSGLRAAADAEIEVSRTPAGRAVRVSKQKDGEDGGEWGFSLAPIVVGQDEDGDDITSCVVLEDAVPVRGGRVARKLGPWESRVLEVVSEIAIGQSAGIEIDAVITEVARRAPPPEGGKRDTRKQHAKRALQRLAEDDNPPFWIDGGALEMAT